jgi:hypothetical protein
MMMDLQTMMMNTNKNNPLKKVGIFFEKVLVELKKGVSLSNK